MDKLIEELERFDWKHVQTVECYGKIILRGRVTSKCSVNVIKQLLYANGYDSFDISVNNHPEGQTVDIELNRGYGPSRWKMVKRYWKIILVILLLLVMVIGYLTLRFVHGIPDPLRDASNIFCRVVCAVHYK